MAYSEYLSEKVENFLDNLFINYKSKRMFGGVCYMIDNKMCLGVVHEEMMCRIDPEIYEETLKTQNCKEMNFTGKPMKGFVFVEIAELEDNLEYWINLCLKYNPKAKSSKK
jgi:TfoX/Sxy family transcriptional regulator of competence genes